MELIARGRDADVFASGDGQVLRRYRRPGATCEAEAATMNWVRRHGYPAPEVISCAGPDLVMARVDGPTLLEAALTGRRTVDDVAEILADLLARLHAIPTPTPSAPGAGIRHLDLHPLNVLDPPAGPVVIDWSNSDVGPVGMDTALSAVILGQVATVPLPAAELEPFGISPETLTELAGDLLTAFLRHAGPLAADDVSAAVRYRSCDPNQSALETAALAELPALLLLP